MEALFAHLLRDDAGQHVPTRMNFHRWMNLHRCIESAQTNWQLPPGIAHLRRWPDLAEVPDPLVLPVSRLCALLTCRSAPCPSITGRLGGDAREIFVVFQMLHAFGYLEVTAAPIEVAALPEVLPTEAPTPRSSLAGVAAFIRRLRDRLLG